MIIGYVISIRTYHIGEGYHVGRAVSFVERSAPGTLFVLAGSGRNHVSPSLPIVSGNRASTWCSPTASDWQTLVLLEALF